MKQWRYSELRDILYSNILKGSARRGLKGQKERLEASYEISHKVFNAKSGQEASDTPLLFLEQRYCHSNLKLDSTARDQFHHILCCSVIGSYYDTTPT